MIPYSERTSTRAGRRDRRRTSKVAPAQTYVGPELGLDGILFEVSR